MAFHINVLFPVLLILIIISSGTYSLNLFAFVLLFLIFISMYKLYMVNLCYL